MPTVKLQNGKVILKDGKVSCSCCDGVECCMYPAAFAVAADLPVAITLNGSSLSKSGTSYGDTTNGVILESGVWARYVDGVRSTQSCLITGDGNYTPGDDVVEDQFAGTITVDWDFDPDDLGYYLEGPIEWSDTLSGSETLSRESLCVWKSVNQVHFVGVLTVFPGGSYDFYSYLYLAYNGEAWTLYGDQGGFVAATIGASYEGIFDSHNDGRITIS